MYTYGLITGGLGHYNTIIRSGSLGLGGLPRTRSGM
jgi:hypothetical protein